LDGIVQVWRGSLDGGASERLTSEAKDVKDFVVSSDGRRIVYSAGAPDLIKERLRREESLRGYRYDERFIPLFANGPEAFPSDTISIRSVDLETRAADRASADDVASLLAKGTAGNSPVATSAQGRVASASSETKPGHAEPMEIIVRSPGHHTTHCSDTRCSGATLIWWAERGRRLRYVRREGWARDETAIYEWQLGRTRPKRLYVTTDLLVGCQPVGDNLLCAREQSRAPRHLVLLDPASGAISVVYDPNPDFNRLALGEVEHLRWRNDFGIETFGDLIYPTGYERGRAYPLIVVQYTSRGFLRGGVGDEFPIQAFANRGYAVLSVQRPDGRNLAPLSATMAEYERALISGFKDRRSVLSSIEVAVRFLVNRGIVDPDRVGITGLSDGSSTVQFAAVNSKTFKAASVSGCCWEPFQDAFIGPGAAQAFHEIGWPQLVDYDVEFWSHISLIHNARRMSMPLLMQQSDDEFRAAIASYTAMKQAGQPVSLFVFPGEHHVKWQPSHRLAAYERNLRWFDYWLKGVGSAEEWGLDK
jgi:dipeptidyl aminopeptidase/acylaminoacyl peptidase